MSRDDETAGTGPAGAPPRECASVRDALAAAPHAGARTFAAHLGNCADCARYAAEMVALDAQIARAFAIRVPRAPTLDPVARATGVEQAGAPGAAAVVTPLAAGRDRATAQPRAPRLRVLAFAASLAGAALLGTLLWTGIPGESLAGAVVGHMSHDEPDAWRPRPAVPASALAYVLRRAGVRLEPGAPEVTYARSCFFRGNFVPHLAVRTAAGVVTVLVLPDERADGRVEFAEGGYRGVIVPATRGALAVLARDGGDGAERIDAATLDAVATQLAAAVRYEDRDAG